MRIGKKFGKYQTYGYIFDCDIFKYKNRTIGGLLFEIKIYGKIQQFELEGAVSIQISKLNGITIWMNYRAKHISVEPHKIYFLVQYENYEEPIEITNEILDQYLDYIVGQDYHDSEIRSFGPECRISGWKEQLIEKIEGKNVVRKKIYKVYGYMFECDTFRYDGQIITGLCCEIRTSSTIPQWDLDRFVKIQLSKENGFSIIISCSARNIFVEPYKIYFLARDSLTEVEEPIEVDHDVLLKYQNYIIENPGRHCAESSELLHVR